MNTPPHPTPPPPPPPHSSHPQSSGLPPGNYDIFVIPPHSSGSGFLYLPSLNTQRNSFLAGIACTLAAVGVCQVIVPPIKAWASTVASSGGIGIAICIMGVAVLGWALGKTQVEASSSEPSEGGGAQSSSSQSRARPQSQGQQGRWAPPPYSQGTPGARAQPDPFWRKPAPTPDSTAWEKAREDMRRQKEAATSSVKADAEKARWDQARAREREAREKEAREKVAAERAKREQEPTHAKEDRAESETPGRRPKHAHAQSYTESVFSGSSATGSTFSTSSSYSTTPTEHTAPPPPPRQHTGPYSTKDPEKVVIKGVYAFTDGFIKPVAELVRSAGSVTDGLVMRMTTEGLFVDDDVRGVPQREWDVKAWGIKNIETGDYRAAKLHVLRATVRDVENKKYVFVVEDSEAWKVVQGLQRLKRGSQVRSMASAGMKESEVARVLNTVGIL